MQKITCKSSLTERWCIKVIGAAGRASLDFIPLAMSRNSSVYSCMKLFGFKIKQLNKQNKKNSQILSNLTYEVSMGYKSEIIFSKTRAQSTKILIMEN